jgi:hypothetical protein
MQAYKYRILFSIGLFGFLLTQCSDDYNLISVNSPQPGILRIVIQSDDAEKITTIAGDTVVAGASAADSLALHAAQGRIYQGLNYAVLYKSLKDYLEITRTVNILRQENNHYLEQLLFETYLPPAVYDSLKIYLSSDFIQIGFYKIPVTMASGSDLFLFSSKIPIYEKKVSEVCLQIKPFSSLVRVGDSYQFQGKIEIARINYY